jgi:alpha-ketoglutarate-dependent taurine dioxygenase
MSAVSAGIGVELNPFGLLIEGGKGGRDPRDLSVDVLRTLAREHHLVLLRGFTGFADSADVVAWCEAWGKIMMWPFGPVLELIEAETPTDHIFDNSYVPLHWDGMYTPHVPEFQIFTCVHAPGEGQGGRTTFCHTPRVLENADSETVELWRRITVTYQIENVVHYGGKAVSLLVVPHPVTGVPTIRYNEPPPADDTTFLNRPSHRFDGVEPDELATRLKELHGALYDERHFYAHSWEEGDIVIADNYTLLHGREAFTHRSDRHIRRVHVLGEPPFANPAVG